jgi:peptidoglycan/xylan/chitin deacetylase (PgdA/CDA1 family)
LDHAQLSAEVAGSKAALEALLMMRGVRHFCYPYGAYDAAAVHATRDGGYTTATTTVRGRVLVSENLDMLQLPRVLVSRTTTWVHLLLKCFTRYEDKRAASPLAYDTTSV